jgi:hypothetical protein
MRKKLVVLGSVLDVNDQQVRMKELQELSYVASPMIAIRYGDYCGK